MAHRGKIKPVEDVEHDRNDQPTARRLVGRDFAAAIGRPDRRGFKRLAISQILHRDQPAIGVHIISDLTRDGAGVKILNAILGDAPVGAAHVRVAQDFTNALHGAVRVEVDLRSCRIIRQPAITCDAAIVWPTAPKPMDVRADRKPILAIGDCGLKRLRHAACAEPVQNVVERAQRQRRCGGLIAHLIHLAFQDKPEPVVAFAHHEVFPHLRRRRLGRAAMKVDQRVRPVGQMDVAGPKPGNAAHLRIDGCLHQRRANCGVDDVAAVLQNIKPSFDRLGLGGGDHCTHRILLWRRQMTLEPMGPVGNHIERVPR